MTLHATVEVELDGFHLALDLAIAAGETVAVLGPNGAGKTTLLRALAGLQPLADGRLVLGDVVLDDPATDTYLAPDRRPIGVVFQDHLLFPHLTALDNVAFGLRSRGMGRRAARTAAAAWLDRVGLGERLRARPSTLSGGQAQRVALARALATDPALLLLDEPLAALDATTRNDVRRDLRAHLASFPGARLLITHDPVDAAVLADRVVVLDAGRVVQTGTPEEITARPRTPWVASLAGTNLVQGVVDQEGTTLVLDDGGSLSLAGAHAPGPSLAVIAPTAVSLYEQAPVGSPRNTWPCSVRTIDGLGDRLRVSLAGQPSIVAEITRGASNDLGLIEDRAVWASVKATEIDVFPA